MSKHTARLSLWIAGTIVLCAYSVAAPQSSVSGDTGANMPAKRVLPGYAHDLSRSRFKIGENTAVELDTTQLRRWRGSLGAWAIDPTNNWSMGLLDSTAPTGPYILDETLHGELVKKYFIAAGIPADQVRDVRATFQVVGGGPINEATQSARPQLQSITSILTRSVEGIPVAESLAWAKMTTSGDVDMECVFWPSIDINVVDSAVAFAKQMADPTLHAAYLAKMPGQVYKDGGVMIHHTDPSAHATPEAYVSYDVTLAPEGYAAMRHFDTNGEEFRLPQELETPKVLPADHQKPQKQ